MTRRADYMARLNRVLEYVDAHLDEALPLRELARVACFSPFHFHRLFAALQGEPISAYVQRLRVERAATLLCANRRRRVTDVALACGFSSSATFARAFKARYGMSATAWRRGGRERARASRQGISNKSFGRLRARGGFGLERLGPRSWRLDLPDLPSGTVEVVALPRLEVAYLRHVGPYQGMPEVFEELFRRLGTWATTHHLLGPDTTFLSVYRDDPELTDDGLLRVEACLTVPATQLPDGEIGRTVLTGGLYGVGRFRLGGGDYHTAWHAMMGTWLPESGLAPDDRPASERYGPCAVPDEAGRTEVDICLPVRLL